MMPGPSALRITGMEGTDRRPRHKGPAPGGVATVQQSEDRNEGRSSARSISLSDTDIVMAKKTLDR